VRDANTDSTRASMAMVVPTLKPASAVDAGDCDLPQPASKSVARDIPVAAPTTAVRLWRREASLVLCVDGVSDMM
jgi:hypothetical protein